MALSTQQQILIEQRVTNEAKSIGAAYLMWFFLGTLGGHNFYLGQKAAGLAKLALFVLGWLMLAHGVGLILLIVDGLWVLVDAFLIPGMVQRHKDKVRRELTATALYADGQA